MESPFLKKRSKGFQFLLILSFWALLFAKFFGFPGNNWAGTVHLCNSEEDCINHKIDYIMIVADELMEDSATYFNSHVDKLAEHRAEYLDLNVGIVCADSTSQGDLWYQPIRDFIRDVYNGAQAEHMADGHLGFVLLVGDKQDDSMSADMVPVYNYSGTPNYASDHYYACITYDSSAGKYDDFPDLMIGRLSVGTAQDSLGFIELRGAVNKTIAYDSLSHAGWGNTVMLASDSEDRSAYYDTLKSIIPGTYSIDELRGWDNWEADSIRAAIISAINNGRWLIDFYGHGAQTKWKYESGDDADSVFSVSDIDSLANKDKYPVIFALSCKTGWFDNAPPDYPDDCIGEELVNADTCGAIAYLGASRTAWPTGSELLFKSIHRALFNDHAYFMGEMVAGGKIALLSKWGFYYYEVRNYNLFGDPAVNIMWSVEDSTNLADLVISQSNITFDPLTPSVGDSITVSAIVENKGLAAADTFQVQCYSEHPDSGGEAISTKQTVPGLSAWFGADTVALIIYADTTDLGTNKIYVVADCDSEVTEISESNNANWNWNYVYLYQENFPDTAASVDKSNPAVADIVDDGNLDILMAGNCWSGDGLAWSFSGGVSTVSSPAIGDLDNDGKQEVVLSFGGDSLFVYQRDSTEYSWGPGYGDVAIKSSPSLAYLDADDTLDIVFALSSQSEKQDSNRVIALHVINDSLVTLWQKAVNGDTTKGAIRSSPAIGDINSNGWPEVVVLSDHGYIYALNGECGRTVWTRHIGGEYSMYTSHSAPVLADVDGDGVLEIIARTNEDSLVVLKGESGEDEACSRYYLGDLSNYSWYRSPCVGDVDGNGELEIIFQADTTLLILSSSLNLEASAKIPRATLGVASPALADINSDNKQEIIVAAGESLFVFDSNADTFLTIPLVGPCEVAPAVGDIDGDGDAELISGYQLPGPGYQGIVHVCDYWGILGEIEWGMFHHDCRRTGCYAQPELGDTISTDKIWSGNVVIHGDVVIDTGATLTIEPGTQVEFTTTDSQSSGEDTTRCELIVYGTLKAVGTEANSIKFTSHAVSPSKSDWFGIVIMDATSDTNEIEYCQIEYAHKGVCCYKCSVDVLNSAISHCSYGAYVDSTGTKLRLSHVSIDSCSYGVRVQQGAARLHSSEFKHNQYGVSCNSSNRYYPGYTPYADFLDCDFDSNSFSGIVLDDSSPIMDSCTSSYNGIWGLKCLDDSDPILGYNTLAYNGPDAKAKGTSGPSKDDNPPQIHSGGLYCAGTSSPIACGSSTQHHTRGHNFLMGNTGSGVHCIAQSWPQLGTFFNWGNNSILNNTVYEVKNETDSLVYAKRNWWGDENGPDTTKIYGPVDWEPCLQDSPGTKGLCPGNRYALLERRTKSRARGATRTTTKGQDPDSSAMAWEYNELGTDYLLQMSYYEAMAAFQYVITNFSGYKAANYALVHLIHCYKEAGYQSDIIPYLENLALDCSNPQLKNLALYMSIPKLSRDGEDQKALSRCQALLATGCDEELEKGLRLREGMLYRYRLNDNEAAISAFRYFIERYPDDPRTLIALVELEILGILETPKRPGEPVTKPAVPLPKTFALHQNYPNPFNAQTCIQYELPKDAQVSLKIYNVLGQRVKTLANDQQRAGRYRVFWGGRNNSGVKVASGIYFIRFEAGTYTLTRKMVLLR